MKVKLAKGRSVRERSLIAYIDDYVQARIEHSWRGARDPSEHEALDLALTKAREDLNKKLRETFDVMHGSIDELARRNVRLDVAIRSAVRALKS